MNWKEQFKKIDWGASAATWDDDIISFIETHIIEKLIADIPEKLSVEVGFAVTKKNLVKELRDKWL